MMKPSTVKQVHAEGCPFKKLKEIYSQSRFPICTLSHRKTLTHIKRKYSKTAVIFN